MAEVDCGAAGAFGGGIDCWATSGNESSRAANSAIVVDGIRNAIDLADLRILRRTFSLSLFSVPLFSSV
jgi:hypothetical protein